MVALLSGLKPKLNLAGNPRLIPALAFWVYEVNAPKPVSKRLSKVLSEVPTTLGDYLWKYRIESGLSRLAFGQLLGVSGNTIGQWEKNIHEPQYTYGPKIIELIGITIIEKLFPPEVFGNKVKLYRLIKGLSQVDLAIQMEVNICTISTWETNEKYPHPEHFNKFMALYEMARNGL